MSPFAYLLTLSLSIYALFENRKNVKVLSVCQANRTWFQDGKGLDKSYRSLFFFFFEIPVCEFSQ